MQTGQRHKIIDDNHFLFKNIYVQACVSHINLDWKLDREARLHHSHNPVQWIILSEIFQQQL